MLDPLAHHLHVAKVPKTSEDTSASPLHGAPGWVGINVPQTIRHGAAATDGHTKIVDRARRKSRLGISSLIENDLHPVPEAETRS